MLARHAATVIQHAYRQYCMTRNFAKLRWESDEKRLSRRFAEFSRSRSIWSDLAMTTTSRGGGIAEECVADGEDGSFSAICEVMTHSYSADNMTQHLTSSVPIAPVNAKAFSSRHLMTSQLTGSEGDTDRNRSGADLDDSHAVVDYSSNKSEGRRNCCELSDSCESVLESPTEPTVDGPSQKFEHVLEDTEVPVEGYESDEGSQFDRTVQPSGTGLDSRRYGDVHTPCDQAQVKLRRKKTSELAASDVPVDVRGSAESVRSVQSSPVWKRKSYTATQDNSGISRCSYFVTCAPETTTSSVKRSKADCSNVVEVGQQQSTAVDCSNSYCRTESPNKSSQTLKKMTDRQRKRAYRVGLNVFNK